MYTFRNSNSTWEAQHRVEIFIYLFFFFFLDGFSNTIIFLHPHMDLQLTKHHSPWNEIQTKMLVNDVLCVIEHFPILAL